ncbi:centromere protein N isoform X2 [Narcine bancroftii]|uniref:centromere protein N isoform X2 n=1 Tax=Narcine bancroftii TaxID=1343680 RepID=UPI0038315259
MDGTEYMIKVLSRFRMADFPQLLKSWDFLSESQIQSVNFKKNTRKDVILQLAALCEDNGVTLKQIADLEVIYNCAYPQKRRWNTYQMFNSKGVEETHLFDFEIFRKTFERNLKMLIRNVMVNILEHGEAVWIRIAWGKRHSPPNQQRPSYAVYYPQTPYVFIANLPAQYRVYVSQTFSVPYRKPLRELNSNQDTAQDQRIIVEHLREKEEAKRLTTSAFGEGSLPKLEEVHYRLQTIFKDELNMGILTDRNKPFRCVAKFSSPNILESLRALPELGVADVPISTMFSSISEKGKNYFKITDKRTGGHNTSAP